MAASPPGLARRFLSLHYKVETINPDALKGPNGGIIMPGVPNGGIIGIPNGNGGVGIDLGSGGHVEVIGNDVAEMYMGISGSGPLSVGSNASESSKIALTGGGGSLEAGAGVLSGLPTTRPLDTLDKPESPVAPGLAAGAYESGEGEANRRLLALNRPATEDDIRILAPEALEALLAGVDYRRIDDEVGSGARLASEVWRAFLVAMALALLAEAILCLPPKTGEEKERNPLRSGT